MKRRLLLALALLTAFTAGAQQRWRFEAGAGLSLGGAVPVPLPVEIRSIEGFNPGFNPWLGGTACYSFGRTGIASGIRIGRKSMATAARVKNYSTAIEKDGNSIEGRWTGFVQTACSAWDVTLPLMAVWPAGERLSLRGGIYASCSVSRRFGGYVSDGYLREGDPTGPKIAFSKDDRADYSFPDALKPIHTGVLAGFTYYLDTDFGLVAELTADFDSIFRSSFSAVSFDMWRIYGSLGASYRF